MIEAKTYEELEAALTSLEELRRRIKRLEETVVYLETVLDRLEALTGNVH